jgi:hypothetical protein
MKNEKMKLSHPKSLPEIGSAVGTTGTFFEPGQYALIVEDVVAFKQPDDLALDEVLQTNGAIFV